MELRHLRYFLAVADTRSFTRAADRLHVTQPTLSHQVKQLEQMVGTVLFDRSTKEVELTDAGRLFKPYCERVLKEIESSALAISELEGLMRGTLRMAVFHSFSHSMLPPIMSEFALRYPGVHVITRLVPRMDMERELINAELDMAVAYIAGDNDQIVAEPLFTEELVVVVGSKCPQASRKSMPNLTWQWPISPATTIRSSPSRCSPRNWCWWLVPSARRPAANRCRCASSPRCRSCC